MKVAVVFGTRPEAIKMAPVIRALRDQPGIATEVVLTAQHRELLDQVLDVFGLRADHDLNVMRPRQSLAELTSRLATALDQWLEQSHPDLLLVQGDTTSAFVGALAAFYRGVPVAHVEAGLRTPTAGNPFPEEMNRRLVSRLAGLHFAPTERARNALLAEGIEPAQVFVTGNTVVDALHAIRDSAAFAKASLPITVAEGQSLVLVTMHRRESWEQIDQVCAAIAQVVAARPAVRVLFPVHPNPVVKEPVFRALAGAERVTLVEALDYVTFVKAMAAAHIVVTDSGGVQEEAPVFGRPVLVLRDVTERGEAVESGVAKLVGTSKAALVSSLLELLDDESAWSRMARAVSPFGDGHAAARIVSIINDHREAIAGQRRARRQAIAQ
jgi:UDP-N-acetylglucosamine 2-epimerase (non-hydrolysing)